MQAVELFAGAGGLALGLGLAGFRPLAVVEWNAAACETVRRNQQRGFAPVAGWPLHEGDVREVDWSALPAGIDLVAGGPPCQPFSMGGKHRAHHDRRDMFPATVDVVRRLRPKAFIVENVKGLARAAFADYFDHIQLQLRWPERPPREGEAWHEHHARLVAARGRAGAGELAYRVVTRLVNAADHGVPQRRERVFIVGFRSDLNIEWKPPEATHCAESLRIDRDVTGAYWDRVGLPAMRPAKRGDAALVRGPRVPVDASGPLRRPWKTVREALAGLPDPRDVAASGGPHLNHRFQPGARAYAGHTGSPLDTPAKTLKAGDHGVPGGENMLVDDDGSVRYFTVRESARLQTFADDYLFHGSWSEAMRQIGNAVPVELARRIGQSVAEQLRQARACQELESGRHRPAVVA